MLALSAAVVSPITVTTLVPMVGGVWSAFGRWLTARWLVRCPHCRMRAPAARKMDRKETGRGIGVVDGAITSGVWELDQWEEAERKLGKLAAEPSERRSSPMKSHGGTSKPLTGWTSAR